MQAAVRRLAARPTPVELPQEAQALLPAAERTLELLANRQLRAAQRWAAGVCRAEETPEQPQAE